MNQIKAPNNTIKATPKRGAIYGKRYTQQI